VRLNRRLVLQLVESEPPVLVLMDDDTGNEVMFDGDEAVKLIVGIRYFAPHL
jgi:hypothetical protein